MKQILLSGLLALMTLGVSAQMEVPVSKRVTAEVTQFAHSGNSRALKRLSEDMLIRRADGSAQLFKTAAAKKFAKPRRAVMLQSGTKDGYVLYENFSGWDGVSLDWTPEGWTVEHKGLGDSIVTWRPFKPNPYMYPGPVDGDYYFGVNYGDDEQDEWFISPAVELGENMQLTWWMFLNPFWMYDAEIDFDKEEYLSEKEIVYTLQILAREEGAEDWTLLKDYAEEYKDLSLQEILALYPSALEKYSISLADFAGKKIQVAFRYIGLDGESVFIDAIGIGYPELEDVGYFGPNCTLFWGFSNDINMTYITQDVAIYPVYAPLTWENYSGEEATYSWEYDDPMTHETATSDDQYELEVTYLPDYSEDHRKKNNLYSPPTLKATAPGCAPGSYTAPYSYFQAGGKFEVAAVEGDLTGCLLPFAPNRQGLARIIVTDDAQGAIAVPVFGYDKNTDQYWLNYTLNGSEAKEGDYSHLIGIGNAFFASEDAPLVVNGLSIYGWGAIDNDAELTATVYGLNSEWSTDYNTFTVISSVTITGRDIERENPDGSKGYLFLPFRFDEPAVLQASEEHPMFVFMLEGFHSDKVEYFAPLQSKTGTWLDATYGYILNEISLNGEHLGGESEATVRYSFKSMVYKVGDEYVDPVGGFAIGVDGEYPWLTCEAEKIELGGDVVSATVKLGSYYDGDSLTVEVPAGLTATVTGRYDDCVLTVTRAAGTAAAVEGTVTVKGPGVEVSLPVSAATSGIEVISAGDAAALDIYDMSGRKVVSPESGVYVVKYSDGNVRKVMVK